MSGRALRLAARDRLRDRMNLTHTHCRVMPDGKPPAFSGEYFLAVHPGRWTNTDTESLDETFGFQVTITMRLPKTAYDVAGEKLMDKADEGLEAICERVRAVIHSGYAGLMNTANDTYISGNVNKFVEPPGFRDGGVPRVVTGNWFDAMSEEPRAGLVQTMTFEQARRVQRIEEQT